MYEKTNRFCFDDAKVRRFPYASKSIQRIGRNLQRIQKIKKKMSIRSFSSSLWALTDSNRRPSACKADALNQLS